MEVRSAIKELTAEELKRLLSEMLAVCDVQDKSDMDFIKEICQELHERSK